MKAYIIAIGKELLLGNVADINTSFIANLLSQESFEVAETAIIDDNPDAVEAKVRQALGQADIVLLTGGLGPTKDDLTRDALMRVFGGELRRDEVTAENVARIMAERSRPMNALTAAQAIVPSSARIIQNPVGTAPILWFETQQFAGKVAVAMPGVPFELREVFANHVLPQLKTRFRTEPVFHAFLQTHNISESAVAEALASLEEESAAHLAYLPQTGYLNLRFDACSAEAAEAARDAAAAILEPYVVAKTSLHPAETLIGALRQRGLTVATAESCTGGNISHRITTIAGCSDVMTGGVVAYSNAVKMQVLGVPEADLRLHGAVSEPVARAMAEGVRRATGADVGIATTGIAGPGGGSPQKPVGTVWMAVATPKGCTACVRKFPGNRLRVIEQATAAALLLAYTETIRNA